MSLFSASGGRRSSVAQRSSIDLWCLDVRGRAFGAENFLTPERLHFGQRKIHRLDTAKLRLLKYAVFFCTEFESVYT